MNEEGQPEFLEALNAEQRRIAVAGWPYLVGYILVNAVPYVYLDLYHWDQDGAYAWAGFFTWALGYLLLVSLMNQAGLFANGKASGVGTYFALCIAIWIFVGLALVAFILPGLYLLMRWLPVYSRALTNREWITQSMRWSWGATEEVQKQLAVAMLGPVLCFGLAVAFAYSYLTLPSVRYELATVLTNLAVGVGIAWFTVLGVAAFSALSERGTAPSREPIKTA